MVDVGPLGPLPERHSPAPAPAGALGRYRPAIGGGAVLGGVNAALVLTVTGGHALVAVALLVVLLGLALLEVPRLRRRAEAATPAVTPGVWDEAEWWENEGCPTTAEALRQLAVLHGVQPAPAPPEPEAEAEPEPEPEPEPTTSITTRCLWCDAEGHATRSSVSQPNTVTFLPPPGHTARNRFDHIEVCCPTVPHRPYVIRPAAGYVWLTACTCRTVPGVGGEPIRVRTLSDAPCPEHDAAPSRVLPAFLVPDVER